MTQFHPTAHSVLEDLRTRYPDAPFLCLGQTVYWDEPMKAVLRLMLDEMGLGGRMFLGVHDTDYFAKVRVTGAGQSHYELLPHNDGSTKDLWSAAGEIARLFGSECLPTRHDLLRHGVPLEAVARRLGLDRLRFLDEATEAWGWRGLVYTGSRDLIVHHMPLRDMGDSVERMLRWGFEGSIDSFADDCCKQEARVVAARLLDWARAYREANPDQTLTGLYQDVLPRLFELLLGAPPNDVEVGCTGHLLRLTPETASLPRFRFVDLFLNERTRAAAARAYNDAVAGSEIYALDKFGLGALPFDLVLPQHGRGTLRITLRAIHVETRHPLRVPLKQPINGIQELAQVLTDAFGSHVTLVGKAVALIPMLAREFIFVFNEEGSLYVRHTLRMNDLLRAQGMDVWTHPILRLRYHTWDGLESGRAALRLPEHLASTFGCDTLPGDEFARRWRGVVEEQDELLKQLKRITSPRDLMAFLAQRAEDGWSARIAGYTAAKEALCALRARALAIQERVNALYAELAQVREDIRATERAKGDHFRATIEWTADEMVRRGTFETRMQALLQTRRRLLADVAALKAERLALERGPEAAPLREQCAHIEAEAENARLLLVRHAILTRTGLVHTQHRPTAWWLPMVDPSGRWFRRVAETAELYTESVCSDCV